MVGRIYLFVIMAITLVMSTAYSKPLNQKVWKFTHLAPQTFLFESQKIKSTVLLTVTATSMTDEQAQKYVLSREFMNDAKLSRTDTILASPDEAVEGGSGFPELFGSVNPSREEIEKVWVGVIETDFGVEGRSALMSERLWVRDGLLFHLLIGSQGTLTPSSESHQKIFAEFQTDLGFGSEKTASLFDLLFDQAHAREIGRSRVKASAQQNNQDSGFNPPRPKPRGKSECSLFAEEQEIEPSRLRQTKEADGSISYGPPRLNLNPSLKECGEAGEKALNEMKEAVLGSVNALSAWNEKQNREAAAEIAKYSKALKCDSLLETDRGSKNESWGASILRSFTNSQNRVAYSKCLESAGNVTNGKFIAKHAEAVGKAAVEKTNQAKAAVGKWVDTDGPTRTAKSFAAFMSNPVGNAASALYRYIDSQIQGFRCLTDREQTAVVCKFLAEQATETVAAGLTAGAGLVVVRGLKAANAIAQRLQTAKKAVNGRKEGELRTADRVKERAEARRFGRDAASREGNELGANISREERGRRAERIIGRKLSEDEIDVLQGMHEIGDGRGYRPKGSKPGEKIEGVLTPGDLRAKIKYAEGANPKGIKLDPKLISASLRTGLTGERSIAAQREVVARFAKDWKDDLDKLNDPKLTQTDLATRGLTVKASDMTYMRIKALDEADFKNVEVFTDNNDHVQLLRFATHSGHTAASDAGEVMAQMVRSVPADRREDYFESLQVFIETQTKSSYSASQRAADHGRFGDNLKDTVGAMYRELKANPPEGIKPEQLERLRIESQSLVTRSREAARNRAPTSASKPAKPEVEVMHNWNGR